MTCTSRPGNIVSFWHQSPTHIWRLNGMQFFILLGIASWLRVHQFIQSFLELITETFLLGQWRAQTQQVQEPYIWSLNGSGCVWAGVNKLLVTSCTFFIQPIVPQTKREQWSRLKTSAVFEWRPHNFLPTKINVTSLHVNVWTYLCNFSLAVLWETSRLHCTIFKDAWRRWIGGFLKRKVKQFPVFLFLEAR